MLRLIHLVSICAQYVLPWALAVVLVIVVRDTALAMTGMDSAPKAWMEIIGHIRVSRGFAFVFGFAGAVYGLQQRNLRRSERKRLLSRIAALEQPRREAKEGV